jgi:hypothetical protein
MVDLFRLPLGLPAGLPLTPLGQGVFGYTLPYAARMERRAKVSPGEITAKKLRNLREPWKPGESGNPAGRPKGSRHKLAESFLADLHADWEKHGATAIVAMREKDPSGYVKVVASVLPRDVDLKVKVSTSPFEDMSDEQLEAYIASELARLVEGECEQVIEHKISPASNVT